MKPFSTIFAIFCFAIFPSVAFCQNNAGDWSHVHVRSDKEVQDLMMARFKLASDCGIVSPDFPKWDKTKQGEYINHLSEIVSSSKQIFPSLDDQGALETVVGLFDLDSSINTDELYDLLGTLYWTKHDLQEDEMRFVSDILHCKEYYKRVHLYQGINGVRLVVKNLQAGAENLKKSKPLPIQH